MLTPLLNKPISLSTTIISVLQNNCSNQYITFDMIPMWNQTSKLTKLNITQNKLKQKHSVKLQLMHTLNLTYNTKNYYCKNIMLSLLKLLSSHSYLVLSGIVPLTEKVKFIPFLLQLFTLHLYTLLDSGILLLQTNFLSFLFYLLLCSES